MKQKISIIITVFILIFTNSCNVQKKSDLSEQKNFPEFSWDKMPLYMHVRKSTAFTPEEIKFLAKYPLITFEKSTGNVTFGSTEAGTVEAAKAVKKINSKAKILYYKNVVINWPSYKEDELFLKENPDAILVDAKGNKAVMPNKKTGFFDLSHDYIREYWLNHVNKMANNPYIDGLFLDANIKVLVPVFFNSRVGEKKQQDIAIGYLSMMEELNKRLGNDNLLIANIIRVRPEFKNEGREYLKYFHGSYYRSLRA